MNKSKTEHLLGRCEVILYDDGTMDSSYKINPVSVPVVYEIAKRLSWKGESNELD